MWKNLNISFRYFFLKRELYYHKIQYSKVPKHDVSAAIFGVVIGAFVVYLSLNTLGSGSPDLSDLSIFFWYIFLIFKIFQLSCENFKFKSSILNLLSYLFFFILYNIIL